MLPALFDKALRREAHQLQINLCSIQFSVNLELHSSSGPAYI